jgi:hypothetical protein
MAKRKTSWTDTNPLNPFRPKYGQISKDRKHVWNGKKWVKYIGDPKKVKISSEEFFGTGMKYGHGGTKDPVKNGKNGKNDKNGKKDQKQFKTGPVVKSVGTVDFNINTPKGLTAYNKALKASKGKKTDKDKDKSTTQVLYGNRNKLSSKNNKSEKKGNKFKTTVHTRHYKTGERLGVMGHNQRRAYEKAAMGKDGKLRTFEGEVAKYEKESGHGQSHLRETKYKSYVRKSDRLERKNKREALKMGRMEKTSGSPLHKPGEKLSLYNKDGSLKTKKNNNKNKQRKWWQVPVSVRPVL